MDQIRAMKAFRQVVDSGGFTAAGRSSLMSKGAVSKQVAALESHLGVQLLNRTTRSLSLTEAGRAFHADSVRILDDLAEAETRATKGHAQPRGLLRINAPLSFGVRRLVTLLDAYLRKHPGLRADLVFDDAPLDTIGDGFDLTLRIRRHLPDSRMSARRIGSIRHVVCASPTYLAQAGTPRAPADLHRHRMLVYGGGGQQDEGRYVLQRDDAEPETITMTPALRINNSLAIREALLASGGMAVTPLFVVDDALADGRLVKVLKPYAVAPHALFAIIPEGRGAPIKTRGFLDLMIERRSELCDDP